MFLERIEIQGFKSFAQRTLLEFPKSSPDKHSITGIVGPNGSGKSNIADAIKWVMGEQSLKNIRGKKTEDVIFSGSEKKSRLGFAEVSLYLNNQDKAVPIEFDEVVITRRLYRDGESEYLINKNPVRLFDITLLLARAHVGQRSFSIIGQGMIDSVLLATPLERKSFFDEAVGIKEHQIKRHQALNKLERSEDNINQAQLLLKELSPQLRSLQRQVKRLEQREQVQAALREFQQEYYHCHWSGLNKTKADQQGVIAQLQGSMGTGQEKLAGLRAELDALEKSASRSQLFYDLQKQLQAKQQEKNRLLREMAVIKGQLEVDLQKQGQLNLAWLYRQEEEINGRIIETQKDLEAFKTEHDALRLQREQKTTRVADVKKTLAEHAQKIEALRDTLAQEAAKGPLTAVSRRIKELHQVFSQFLKKLQKATAEELTALVSEAQGMQTELEQLQHVIRDEIDGSAKEEAIKVSESQELWQLQETLNTLTGEQEQLLPEITRLEIQIRVQEEKKRLKERDLDQFHNELKRVRNDLSSQQAAQTGNVNTEAIKEQQSALDGEMQSLDKDITELEGKVSRFNQEAEAKQSKVFALERAFQEEQQGLNRLLQQQHTIQVELARTETKLEDLETEIRRELGEISVVQAPRPEKPESDVATLPLDHIFSQIEKLKYQLELIGGIDPETLTEYTQVKERHDFLTHQIDDLEKTMNQLERVIQELDKTISVQFDQAFNRINKEFERYFQILFGGGRAKLIKVMEEEAEETAGTETVATGEGAEAAVQPKPEETEEEAPSRARKYRRSDYRGIDIFACPPGKKLSAISMLSGGERSLTSLALIAAIIHNTPTPFVLMDEVDAALDEANSQRMARILEDLRSKTQFIIITHNRTVMSIADMIYGVTMGGDGVSKLLSVKLEEAKELGTRL
ncbi:MAG: AAA family ATPase [Parcubacteria group bacterium]|nr:AAA family ATPase [Parcubacteria group bacterium]